MKKNTHVVGAILVKDNKILCAKRGYGKKLGGLWEFPGGKIEANETPQQALIRELQEELNITVDVVESPFETTHHDYDFGHIILTTFICHLISGTPILTEHEEIRWLRSDELIHLEWAPADIPAVNKLKGHNW